MQEHYAFRAWTHDVLVWSVACDADPARKAAMLAMSLRGTAYEYVRTLPPMVLIQGGQINGHAVDPLTFLMHSLAERFGSLGEEMRLTSITDLFHFKRNAAANERIDEVITRFDMLRQRAFDMGQLTISVTGLTWLLLRACEVSDTQLLQLLGPFQGRFPQDEAEFSALKVQLRRMGHILEHSPGNIAASLRGPGGSHQNPTRAYLAEAGDGTQPPQPTAEPWNEGWPQGAVPTWHASDSYSHPTAQPVWYAEDSENGTDTDTASSSGETVVPQATPEGDTDPQALTEYLFWAYTRAKAAWRKHLHKPTRAVRRHTRRYIYSRSKGSKGFKGKGYKGRPNVSTFLAELGDDEVEYVFKGMRKGKGKGKAYRSTGKGKGRKSNPKGRDGQTLRCFRCGSEAHLSRECHLPRTDAHANRTPPQPPSTFYAYTPSSAVPDDGPLSGLIFMASPAEEGVPGAAETDSSWSYPSQPSASAAPDPWATYLRQQGVFRNPAGGPSPPAAEQRSTQSPFVNASAIPSAYRPGSGPGEGVPYTSLGHETGMSRMIVEAPAPTLPTWVQLPEFGYVSGGTVHRPPEHTPLLASNVSSNLEGPMATLLDNFVSAGHAVTQRWLGQEAAVGSATPAAEAQSSLDATHQPTFNAFSQAQQTMQARRREARQRQRRIIQLPEAADTQPYEAVDDTCPLCREIYLEHDSVVRLICRHLYHTQCWAAYLMHDRAQMHCPVCRGSARVIARFSYVPAYEAESELQTRPSSEEHAGRSEDAANAESPGTRTPPRRPANHDMSTPPTGEQRETENPESPYNHFAQFESFPWWPATNPDNCDAGSGAKPETCVVLHQTTQAPDCLALLVDPGAFTNLAGLDWVRRMSLSCLQHGLQPSQHKLAQPLHIQGVGHGHQQCIWSARIPIATPCVIDGEERSSRHFFEAPVVGGPGAGLPALLGLKSLREKGAILVMSPRDAELRLIVPGPAGCKVELCPGSIEYPLFTSPSGHLLLRCDQFQNTKEGSLSSTRLVFTAGEQDDDQHNPSAAATALFPHGLDVVIPAAGSSTDIPPVCEVVA